MTNNADKKLSRWWLLLEAIIIVAFLVVVTMSPQCSCQTRMEIHDR